MLPALLGKKIGMTELFAEDGRVVPVTLIQTGPCTVLQVKTTKTDGYNAVQMGLGDGKKHLLNKPMAGHLKASNVTVPKRFIREIRLPDGPAGEQESQTFKPGTQVGAEVFEGVWKVKVTGTTKGRGFTGMVKRWNKHRGPESHGSMNVRAPGSSGSDTRLTHIRPGRHMPGHYGVETVTTTNLELVKIDKPRNLLFVKGSVPGMNGGWVIVKKTTLVKPAPPKTSTKKKIEPKAREKKK